jgi:hypothetical protein
MLSLSRSASGRIVWKSSLNTATPVRPWLTCGSAPERCSA